MPDLAIWLVVPVKPLGEGKSRLAPALPPAVRAEYSRRWLKRILALAANTGRFAGQAVISRDAAVLALAATEDATPILEQAHDLNAALDQARAQVCAAGAAAVLALPADLPSITAQDLHALCDLALAGDGVVITPSYDGGTNALLLRPPCAIPYAFGPDSYARHCALAAAADVACRVYRSATLAWDVDYPTDLPE
jgi:2-phospho-L-lactate guanylyltransferase